MKKLSKNTAPGFNVWQGYVSSISSLLIALLMLMGILGMATSVIQEPSPCFYFSTAIPGY